MDCSCYQWNYNFLYLLYLVFTSVVYTLLYGDPLTLFIYYWSFWPPTGCNVLMNVMYVVCLSHCFLFCFCLLDVPCLIDNCIFIQFFYSICIYLLSYLIFLPCLCNVVTVLHVGAPSKTRWYISRGFMRGWVISKWPHHERVSHKMIRAMAKQMEATMSDSRDEEFAASAGWLNLFLRHNNLTTA